MPPRRLSLDELARLAPDRVIAAPLTSHRAKKGAKGGRIAGGAKKGMTDVERAWMRKLELRKAAGEVAEFWFERVKLKLADKTHYTPDFMVQLADGSIELHECKGFWEEDARVKFKVVADQFPFVCRAIKMVKGQGAVVVETLGEVQV